MPLEHACFISFPDGSGKATEFAQEFYDELTEHLAVYDKTLSVFKYDRHPARRRGDDWARWIGRELCASAMMVGICSPSYFNGSPGCVAEFRGMERLIADRTGVLREDTRDWLLALRLKRDVRLPALDPYDVRDFFDCCASPQAVRRKQAHRLVVEELAARIHRHWQWLHDSTRAARLAQAGLCAGFSLPPRPDVSPAPFPFVGSAA